MASRNLANVLIVEPRYADPLALVHFKKVLVTKGGDGATEGDARHEHGTRHLEVEDAQGRQGRREDDRESEEVRRREAGGRTARRRPPRPKAAPQPRRPRPPSLPARPQRRRPSPWRVPCRRAQRHAEARLAQVLVALIVSEKATNKTTVGNQVHVHTPPFPPDRSPGWLQQSHAASAPWSSCRRRWARGRRRSGPRVPRGRYRQRPAPRPRSRCSKPFTYRGHDRES